MLSSCFVSTSMVLRRADIMGSGRSDMMTGSSLYSRAMMIHMSMFSRCMSLGRIVSRRFLSHLFFSSACCLSGSILCL